MFNARAAAPSSPLQALSPEAPRDQLAAQLVERWQHAGAPRTVLRRAERVSPGFAARHLPIRRDRQRLENLAWVVAFAASALTAHLLFRLVELPVASLEAAVRLAVAGLLLALAAAGIGREKRHLPLLMLGLIGLSLIYLAAAPENGMLARWDRHAVLLGWGIVTARAVRMCLDRLLDRMEAELLLRAAGCR